MSILFLSLRKLLWDSSCSVQLNSNQNIQIKIFKSKYPTGLSEFAHKVWATPSSAIYSWLYPQGWPLSSESRGIGKMFLFFMQVFKERVEGPYTYENFALFPPEIWKCHHSAFSGTVWIQEGKWQPINFLLLFLGHTWLMALCSMALCSEIAHGRPNGSYWMLDNQSWVNPCKANVFPVVLLSIWPLFKFFN